MGDTFVIFVKVTAKPDFVFEFKICKYSLCIHINRNQTHCYEIGILLAFMGSFKNDRI